MSTISKSAAISAAIMLAVAGMPAAAAGHTLPDAPGSKEIITEVPQGGRATDYYADFLNYDNTFGFMGDYHTVQTLTWMDDGTVYIPNLLLRRTMPAYVKGIYDKDAATVTVEGGQAVFRFPNEGITVVLCALDADGRGGASASEPYTEPLVFDIAADGTLSLRSSAEYPMFGLCNASSTDEVYQNASELSFTDISSVEPSVRHYTYTYRYADDGSEMSSSASAYTDGAGNLWIKGFDPKYADHWIKAGPDGAGGYTAQSFQAVYYFQSEDPIVFAALMGNDAVQGLPIGVDAASGVITAAFDGPVAANITPDNGGSYEIYQTYDRLTLTPAEFTAVKPEAPSFISYSPSNSAGETEFIFSAYPMATDGSTLLQDKLAFRLYIDGSPYTFTKDDYRWLTQDMALVPYTFDNYNFFSQGGDNKEKRYVYLKDLPTATATIGVELVYNPDGTESVSDRLVYDIATGEATVAGIRDITAGQAGGRTVYYDLQGIEVTSPEAGRMYIRKSGDRIDKIIVK